MTRNTSCEDPLMRSFCRRCRNFAFKRFSGNCCYWFPVSVIFVFLQIRGTDSMYHLLSPTESCSIVARLNETLSLLCVHPIPSHPLSTSRGHVTSAEATSTSDDDDHHRRNVECHFRSFVWRRIRSNGETTTITDSRRFNVRRGGDQVEKGSGKKISILKIGSLQTEDVSRYRCDIECTNSKGIQFTRHHTVSVCIQQSHHQYAFCETFVGDSRCSRSFSDGVCDSICNSESHLFDGFDCVRYSSSSSAAAAGEGRDEGGGGGGGGEGSAGGRRGECPADIDQKCRRSYADGICDAECDIESCARDGGDCVDRPLRLVDDVLVLSVAESFHREPGHHHHSLLVVRPLEPKSVSRSVSRLLRTVVRVLTDDWISSHLKDDHQGHPRRDSDGGGGGGGGGGRGGRGRRDMDAAAAAAHGSMRVYLKIDNTNCFSSCFDSSETASKFISMSLHKGWSPGFRITSVAVLQKIFDRCPTTNDSFPLRLDSDSVEVAPPGEGGDGDNRLFGYSHWTTEDSKNALVWVVIAAVVGGMTVVLLVFAAAVLVSRINAMFQRRRRRRRSGDRRRPRCPSASLAPQEDDEVDGLDGETVSLGARTTSAVVIGERCGTEV